MNKHFSFHLIPILLFILFFNISLPSHAAPNWQPIDELIQQRKLTAANKKIDVILKQAKANNDSSNWTRALISKTYGLKDQGQVETAVRFLQDEEWPQDEHSQLILKLFYADSLSQYIQMYSWEIQQRESIETSAKLDLKKMTMDQLLAETNSAYEYAWVYQEAWTEKDTDKLKRYLMPGTYPERIRGTLRDTITYLWVNFLGSESLWNARHSNETYQLNLQQLLTTPVQGKINPADGEVHPLKRIAWLLADLETWHKQNNRPEAALEAARVRILRLSQSRTSEDDNKRLTQVLRSRIQQTTALPWSNMGRWTLAQLIQKTSAADALIKTKAVLNECVTLHANSEGSKQCNYLLKNIMKPVFNIQAMKSDGLQKRSIEVMHKNVSKLYFRAWKVDFLDYLKKPHFKRQELIKSLVKQKTAHAQWSVDLPTSRDYRQHRTFVTPPMKQFGYWIVVASDNPSFAIDTTDMHAIGINLTAMTAQVSNKSKNVEVTVFHGESGQLAANVTVELWQKKYPDLTRKLKSVVTGKEGRAILPVDNQNQFAIVLRRGKDMALLEDVFNYPQYTPGQVKSSLLFTDRSIYRPGQKIQWKVVAYQGNQSKGHFRTIPNAGGWVKLQDANGKVVREIKVKTNSFGSASGEFDIAQGRMMGRWSISTSWQGHSSIRVEEYKRPTFSAKIDDSKAALRLNQTARITGTARYYFGQTVTDGQVKWKVTRQLIHDWRWRVGSYDGYGGYRGGYRPSTGVETIATGTTTLNDKGQFSLSFLPKGNEQLQHQAVSYQFQVSAEITDSGGETRNANRSYRLGAVSIETKINSPQAFASEGESYLLDLSRTDLDGIGRTGNAHWRLHQLQQPNMPLLPADFQQVLPKNKQVYATKGDKKSARWASNQMNEEWLRSWKDGQQVRHGTLQHDKAGKAKIELKGLSAGIYRLYYTTIDVWGKRFETQHDVIVGSRSGTKQVANLQLSSFLKAKKSSIEVGENAELLVGSAFKNVPVTLEIYHANKMLKRQTLRGGIQSVFFPVEKQHRGGLTFIMTAVKDYQILTQRQTISVPWTDRQLNVAFSTFRDKLRPGEKEIWRITVKDSNEKSLETGAAEVLASMYDKSLDFFARHDPANPMTLYSKLHSSINTNSTQGVTHAMWNSYRQDKNPQYPGQFDATRLASLHDFYAYLNGDSGNKALGGNKHSHPAVPGCTGVITHSHAYTNINHRHKYSCQGRRAQRMGRSNDYPQVQAEAAPAPVSVNVHALQRKVKASGYSAVPMAGARAASGQNRADDDSNVNAIAATAEVAMPQIRTNFNETAFFYPHLTLEKDGSVSFEFEAPESLTEWNVWVSAITRDLRSGSVRKQVRTSKELMVRPYLPRFLREGDRAEIEVVVNNMGDKPLSGNLEFELFNPETDESLAGDFKLTNATRHFQLQAGKSTHLRFALTTPNKPGLIAIRTKASAGQLGDGEQRFLPILPSRLHLAQSRFVTLQDKDSKTLSFDQLATSNDPTRINDKLVVSVEGQLFYSVLNALPYLVEYPYECNEQTLNRYLSTSIVKSVFDKHPAVASMAKKLSKRKSQYEQWDNNDPNRKMLLEETPWLTQAEGGSKDIDKLFRILDPQVANAQRANALQKLRKSQKTSGAFPWWSGGADSPYMTMYMLHGFSRALEFKSAVPKDMVQRAWQYLHNEYKDDLKDKQSLHNITFINYLLSAYPDVSWSGGVFSDKERKLMLDQSFSSWKELSGLLKSYLALTLHRTGRNQDARLVFDSIMDAAKTDSQLGTYWMPEDRSWLWYNDNVDTHAFILRTLTELDPADTRRQGVVQWLMLDKKLNHWKSTRATAESIYALVHYLKYENQLALEERATVQVGSSISKDWVFKPEEYTGHNNQLIIQGNDIKSDMANITVSKDTQGLMFASATWHFSTEKLPKQAQGDFFHVSRKFYKRVQKNKQWTLQPLAEGASVAVGDQLEVQLSLTAKHSAEYIHLRSPRAAGYEPVSHTSGYKWGTGIGYYEEIRDSGANYFFEHLPAGQYSFKYRLRATTAGQFRTAPAMVQSMYAPEFTAYSSGKRLQVK